MLNEEQIEAIIFNACMKMGCRELYPEIEWSFNHRFTSQAGNANMVSKFIQFSSKLFMVATAAQQEDVIRHEVAHLGHSFLSDNWRNERHHGKEWERLALLAGAPLGANSDIKSLAPTKKAYCKCGEMVISKNRHTRIKRGARYLCGACETEINL